MAEREEQRPNPQKRNTHHPQNRGRGQNQIYHNLGVRDLREILDKKRSERGDNTEGTYPPPDPSYNYLKDPSRDSREQERQDLGRQQQNRRAYPQDSPVDRSHRGGNRSHQGGDRSHQDGDWSHQGKDWSHQGGDRGHQGEDRGHQGGDRRHQGGDRGHQGGDRGHQGEDWSHQGEDWSHQGGDRRQQGWDRGHQSEDRGHQSRDRGHQSGDRSHQGGDRGHKGGDRNHQGGDRDHQGEGRGHQSGYRGDQGEGRSRQGGDRSHQGGDRSHRGGNRDIENPLNIKIEFSTSSGEHVYTWDKDTILPTIKHVPDQTQRPFRGRGGRNNRGRGRGRGYYTRTIRNNSNKSPKDMTVQVVNREEIPEIQLEENWDDEQVENFEDAKNVPDEDSLEKQVENLNLDEAVAEQPIVKSGENEILEVPDESLKKNEDKIEN